MRILVGMSGGIDSTYAALKLIKEGHEVEGAVLLMHEYTEVESAKAAATSLSIPLHVIDATELFRQRVIPNFLTEYTSARTPNPCIVCNAEVKFRCLCDFAAQNGFDAIATGHYAAVKNVGSADLPRYAIAQAADKTKDQSYMLYRLTDDILSVLCLPLSGMSKAEIREQAREAGIYAADKADSQEICFIPDGDYAAYIEAACGASPEGDFVDMDGNVLGRHKGLIHYTVGQRKGLGVSAGARIFVTDIDPVTNRITLAYDAAPVLNFEVTSPVFSGDVPLSAGEKRRYQVKLRYRATPVPCTVSMSDDGRVLVALDVPQRAVAAGQSAVFYSNGTVMMGGFITPIK